MTEPSKHTDIVLNDKLMRLIGIPLFGIVIPNVTGLFGRLRYDQPLYWIGYVYFIALAAFIWQGNRYLLFRTRRRFTWFDKPIEKIILLFINNIFYTSPLTIAWLCLWYRWAGMTTKWDIILVVTLVNVICVLFVTHVYETVFMVKEQQGEQLKNSELSRAKAEAELEALKNQIDPHFLFNSLNTLTYLIKSNQEKAFQFTENLAEVYRYILSQKDHALVLLEDELAFTQKYIDLLHLRFGAALIVQNNLDHHIEKDFLIPPTSVFVAFENAVKHNELSEQRPLSIALDFQNESLLISNPIQQKNNRAHSSKIGLTNLEERFRITTGKRIEVNQSPEKFTVKLPLVPLQL